MIEIDTTTLLDPITAENPCGPNLEYDLEFLALETALQAEPGARHLNWEEIYSRSRALLGRTKDLRVVIFLLRAATHQYGWIGFCAGMQLLRSLLERYWDTLHPMLDPEDDDDPTIRLSALASLCSIQAVLWDLRRATPDGSPTGVTVRDIELAHQLDLPIAGEVVPLPDPLHQLLAEELRPGPAYLQQLHETDETVQVVQELVAGRVSPTDFNLQPLRRLTTLLRDVVTRALSEDRDTERGTARAADLHSSHVVRVLSPDECNAAIAHLQRLCAWLDSNGLTEHSAALIRRAQRLRTDSFSAIVRDVAPHEADRLY